MWVRCNVAFSYRGRIASRKVNRKLRQSIRKDGLKSGLRSLLLIGILLFGLAGNRLDAQSTITREGVVYPIPPKTTNRMFFLQRTPNTNTIACDLNVDDKGNVDLDNPLRTYWLRYGDQAGGPRKSLNFIQRHFAYGLTINKISDGKYEFWFVSYRKYHMYLVQAKNGTWQVYGKINGQLTVLDSIFIYIKGGSFWNPHVVYVELRGKNPTSGKMAVERLSDVKKEEVS